MAKLTKDYNLAALYPDIAKEWHQNKNGELTPDEVTPGSGKKVWWICYKEHDYKASIAHRKNGTGCPYCSNKKVGYGNDFASMFPKIAKQWHPKKNGEILPSHYTYGTDKKVWWICSYGHEWKASFNKRSRGRGCPKCIKRTSREDLYIFSELSSIFKKVYHTSKIKNMEVDIYIKDLNLGIEYDGYFWHKDKVDKDKRKKQKLKQYINLFNIRESPLEKIDEVDLQWNANKDYYSLIKKILKHIINSDFVLEKKNIKHINNYLKKDSPQNEVFFQEMVSQLPVPIEKESLKIKFPEIAKEWHPTKNGNLTPRNFSEGSKWNAWWICSKGHEYQHIINRRVTRNANCQYCSGHKIGYGNDFKSTYPNLVKEWNYDKNKNLLPENISTKNVKKVWWICNKGHEWQTRVAHRANGSNCPYCCNQKVGYGNDLETKSPKLAKEWHPTKNSDLTPDKITPGSNKKVWWQCSICYHEWETSPNFRFGKHKTGCPKCNKGGWGNKRK